MFNFYLWNECLLKLCSKIYIHLRIVASFKVILHQVWVKKFSPWKFNLEYGGTFTKQCMHVSSWNMFPTIRNLQIRVHVYRPRHCCGDFRLFCSDDCRSWPREEKINNHGCWGKHAHIPDTDYWGICLFHVVWTIFFVGAIILMWYTRNVFLLASVIFFINWIVRMSDNLPERVQILGHAHIICITVRENRIICCQIFCDLLLKSAFERIFNVIQLILDQIKWPIKWKYLIQKFHDICLSYYFKTQNLLIKLVKVFCRKLKES